MTRGEVLRIMRAMIEPEVAALGFTEYDRHYFKRSRRGLQDVFTIDPDRQAANFHVLVGIHVPALQERDLFVTGMDQPVAMISHRLGQLHHPAGVNHSFGCANMDQISVYVPRMIEELKEFALPWYERFQSVRDVAAEWKRIRIDPRPEWLVKEAGPAPADPYGWAEYGWLLEQAGERQEAEKWWHKAYGEVTRPLFTKDGRFVPEGTKGARRVRHPKSEERLEELLRQSLGLPLPV